MKKLVALLICLILICTVFAFTSCEYQDSVDSVRSDLMDSAKEMLDPFLNQSNGSSSATNSSADGSIDEK